jgi:hypothetical protein
MEDADFQFYAELTRWALSCVSPASNDFCLHFLYRFAPIFSEESKP